MPSFAVRGAAHARWMVPSFALAAACSPSTFAMRERAAERALVSATAEGADANATYEYVLAKLYLDKAREESGEAHYAWALSLLAKSEQAAQRARTLVAERARSTPSAASRTAR